MQDGPSYILPMEKNAPKYLEITEWIREQIGSGKLQAGEKIVSENNLSKLFSVSRQTVRHAIGVLVEEGILVRVQGSGTFVNQRKYCSQEGNKRLAVVTTYVDGYIFPRMIQGIEKILFEKGYSVQMAFTNNLVAKERSILEDILRKNEISGLITETTKSGLPNPNLGLYRELADRGIPVLFINSYYTALPFPHVSMNDRMAGREAVRHLLSMGHRKIGGVFKLDDGQGHLRYQGYMEAMYEKGISYQDADVVWIDTEDVRNLEKCGDRILERTKDCTALVVYNDEVAFGLLEVLKKRRIRVPEDLSLVSIDDSDLAFLGGIRLSSVPYPMERLGEKAACNLVQMLQDKSFEATFEFEVQVISRDSVKRMNPPE